MIANLTQHLLYLIFSPIVFVLLRLSVVPKTSWDPKSLTGPVILVSNHRSFLDPFILLGSLPFNSKVWPVRMLASKRFYEKFYDPFGVAMRLAGCTPVGRSSDGSTLEEILREAEAPLRNNEVMLIFPEGRISKAPRPTRGGRGAAYLSMKTGAQILPFYIEGDEDLSFSKVIFGRRKVRLFVGEPFQMAGDWTDETELRRGTEKIISEIGALSEV